MEPQHIPTDSIRCVTVKRARQMLGGMSEGKIYQLMADGELPYVKMDRSRRIEIKEIDAYIARHRVGTTLPMSA